MLIQYCGPSRVGTARERGPAERKRVPGRLAGDPWERTCAQASRTYFTACLRAERTAASMALLVTVAPATPSIWSLWAASTCWA